MLHLLLVSLCGFSATFCSWNNYEDEQKEKQLIKTFEVLKVQSKDSMYDQSSHSSLNKESEQDRTSSVTRYDDLIPKRLQELGVIALWQNNPQLDTWILNHSEYLAIKNGSTTLVVKNYGSEAMTSELALKIAQVYKQEQQTINPTVIVMPQELFESLTMELKRYSLIDFQESFTDYSSVRSQHASDLRNYQSLDANIKTLFEAAFYNANIAEIPHDQFAKDLIQTNAYMVRNASDPLTIIVTKLRDDTDKVAALSRAQQPHYSAVKSMTVDIFKHLYKSLFFDSNLTTHKRDAYIDALDEQRRMPWGSSYYTDSMHSSTVISMERQIELKMAQDDALRDIVEEMRQQFDWDGIKKEHHELEIKQSEWVEQSYDRSREFIREYEHTIAKKNNSENLRSFNNNIRRSVKELRKNLDVLRELKSIKSQKNNSFGRSNTSIQEDIVTLDNALNGRSSDLILDLLIIQTEDRIAVLLECANINNEYILSSERRTKRIIGTTEVAVKAASNVYQNSQNTAQNEQHAIREFNNQPVAQVSSHSPEIEQLFKSYAAQQNQGLQKIQKTLQEKFIAEQDKLHLLQNFKDKLCIGPSVFREERQKAVEQTIETNGQQSYMGAQVLNTTSQELNKIGFTVKDLIISPGTAIQNQLFKENFSLIEKLAKIYGCTTNPEEQKVVQLLAKTSKQAILANNRGDITKSKDLTDLAYGYLEKLGDGASDSVKQIVYSPTRSLLMTGALVAGGIVVGTELVPVAVTYEAAVALGGLAVRTGLASASTKILQAAVLGSQVPQIGQGGILDLLDVREKILSENKSQDHDQRGKVKEVKAPGVPTEKDGFFPPKKWNGEKVRDPNGRGYGYPDKNGRIWIPTGTGPLAHGGPHWDVQDPKTGDHDNVMPGGYIRGQKNDTQ